jgi:hypothetical protein
MDHFRLLVDSVPANANPVRRMDIRIESPLIKEGDGEWGYQITRLGAQGVQYRGKIGCFLDVSDGEARGRLCGLNWNSESLLLMHGHEVSPTVGIFAMAPFSQLFQDCNILTMSTSLGPTLRLLRIVIKPVGFSFVVYTTLNASTLVLLGKAHSHVPDDLIGLPLVLIQLGLAISLVPPWKVLWIMGVFVSLLASILVVVESDPGE